jgi:Holliday junction resolvasome RuvABC ATP-dependent DNA helicase subunit|tara:strand:+ start:1067 stop:1978 length:912 start_codon:yes stop_codon:yes gene_type:complete
MKMFSKLVGQPEVKSQLSFYAQAEKAGSIIPPIMLNGSKGLGKTEFAKHFAVGMGKKLVEINCGSIRNAGQFLEQVFMPAIAGQEVSVLLDECHALPKDLVDIFLTVFNVEGAKSKTVNFGESGFATFDFTKQNFLFATTELDKIFAPLKDRMTIVDFQPYTPQDLKYIIKNKKDWIGYDPTVLNEIASSVRGNARSAVKRVLEISSYCNIKKIDFVDKSAWAGLKKILGIRPFGLSNIEVQILKTLSSHGPSSLQMLSAVTGMSRSALQRDAENGLLKDGFMTIEGKRMITPKGRKLLKELV